MSQQAVDRLGLLIGIGCGSVGCGAALLLAAAAYLVFRVARLALIGGAG